MNKEMLIDFTKDGIMISIKDVDVKDVLIVINMLVDKLSEITNITPVEVLNVIKITKELEIIRNDKEEQQ